MIRTSRYSAGARYERKALRAYLERKRRMYGVDSVYDVLLKWVRGRQSRYDKKKGGL